MPTNCLEIRTEKVLIKANPSHHRLYFLSILLFCPSESCVSALSLSDIRYLWFIIYVEYNYDNVIMWKPCSLILTIPPHLNDFRFMEILTESVLSSQFSPLDIDIQTSPSPATRYISKVSSPDGFSIQNLWSVTKFKFWKLGALSQSSKCAANQSEMKS